MKVSIYDVANLAGVSISTVSRVLNKSGYVSSKTEKKVYDAVEKLNFTPNVIAQNLANNETKLIGLYFPLSFQSTDALSSHYVLEFIKGVNEVLVQHGYHLLLINETKDQESILAEQHKPQYYSFIKQKRIDGLIVGSTPVLCSSFLELLHGKMPIAYAGPRVLDQSGLNVYAQYKHYRMDVLQHFYNRQHRHITFINITDQSAESIVREFELDKKDPYLRIEQFYHSGSLESYLKLLQGIFDSPTKPTALFIEDMSRVPHTVNFLNKIKLEIPKDVSIISVEHKFAEGEQCFPPITSVYVPAHQMGVEAAAMLFRFLQEKQGFNQEVLVESNIIDRASVTEIDQSVSLNNN